MISQNFFSYDDDFRNSKRERERVMSVGSEQFSDRVRERERERYDEMND